MPTIRNKTAVNALNEDMAKTSGWSQNTLDFFCLFQKAFTSCVGFDQRGKHEMYGQWPSFHFDACVRPSSNPVNWRALFDSILHAKVIDRDKPQQQPKPPVLSREEFTIPDIMVWCPELHWPHLYPSGRPCCKWHNNSVDCVARMGQAHYPRRCYDINGNTALVGYRYKCKIREEQSL